MSQGKAFSISKYAVLGAWAKVRANQGAAGADGVSVQGFEQRLKNNLYRIWNRMSSGSYFPPPVLRVMIPKASGGERPLGIPTVGDRVAQMVVKGYLEPLVEPLFHPDSYGYRPGKSALEAVGSCRKRCWCYDWVVDLDIRGFFDNIDHALMLHAVRKHTDCPWVLLYIERWLKAPAQAEDGTLISREKGTPQGGVISPLLANIFLHHVFDQWMSREHPACPFERYADDVVIHCRTREEAQAVKASVEARLRQCKLEAHPEKTRLVYCRDSNRVQDDPQIQFDFLGYRFQPRSAKRGNTGRLFVSFSPAISPKAQAAVAAEIRDWRIHRQSDQSLDALSGLFNAKIRGWVNYYGRYGFTVLRRVFDGLNRRLIRWAQMKYKRYRGRWWLAKDWLCWQGRQKPGLFAHWDAGILPW
jgi:RNA-directed DNA polymerase